MQNHESERCSNRVWSKHRFDILYIPYNLKLWNSRYTMITCMDKAPAKADYYGETEGVPLLNEEMKKNENNKMET